MGMELYCKSACDLRCIDATHQAGVAHSMRALILPFYDLDLSIMSHGSVKTECHPLLSSMTNANMKAITDSACSIRAMRATSIGP